MSIALMRKVFYKSSFFFFILPAHSQIITPELLEQFDQIQQLQQNNSQELINLDNQTNIQAPQDNEIDSEEEFISIDTLSFGTLELQNFGYDIFREQPFTFSPITDLPVPSDYIIGPGDNINIQLFGNNNAQYSLQVTRDGLINFPQLGPIMVSGLSFEDLRSLISDRVSNQMIGVEVSTTLADLRSVRVFVLGDVEKPGSYLLSGFSTIINSLFVSGGLTDIGSLRYIELRRSGETIALLDLYEFLLEGDSTNDVMLMSGDVIFVPAIKNSIALDGQIRRPGIYEILENSSLEDIIAMSGGLLPNTDVSSIKVERIIPNQGSTLLDINLNDESNFNIENGDIIYFSSIPSAIDGINLVGNVSNPGVYQWYDGVKISDIISKPSMLLPDTDFDYALIRRQEDLGSEINVLSFSVNNIFSGVDDRLLSNRDTIYVFKRSSYPEEFMDTLEELNFTIELIPPNFKPFLRAPTNHPLFEEMLEQGYLEDIEEDSFNTVFNQPYLNQSPEDDPYSMYTPIEEVPLEATQAINQQNTNQQELIEDPNLLVPEDNRISAQILDIQQMNSSKRIISRALINELQGQGIIGKNSSVEVSGAVRDPGIYPFSDNMKVLDLIAAGGGLDNTAYLDEAELVKEPDLESLVSRVADTVSIDLNQLVINGSDSADNVVLSEGDNLHIREFPQVNFEGSVVVTGEVVFPGLYTIRNRETLSSVLERAGGLTDQADPRASIFLRTDLQEREINQRDRLISQLEAQIANSALSSQDSQAAVMSGQALVTQLRTVVPTGRLVIPLEDILSGEPVDIELTDGDQLFIPRVSQEVTVLGEVYNPTSHFFNPDFSLSDYIEASGGANIRADKSEIYVVRADGSVVSGVSSNFFSRSSGDRGIQAGDTVVVPMSVNVVAPIALWTSVTQILYNTAIAVTAINSM